MHSSADPLAPIFRSRTQSTILARVFLSNEPATIADLVKIAKTNRTSVLREVDRLADAGIVRRSTVGRTIVVTANRSLPWASELEGLLAKTVGVAAAIGNLLADDDSIDEAAIFGSWAARYHGNPGAWPHDIDIVIVGADLSPMRLRGDLAELEPELGVEISPVLVSPEEWESADPETFLGQIKAGSLVPVKPWVQTPSPQPS